jgi:hypothetical protein
MAAPNEKEVPTSSPKPDEDVHWMLRSLDEKTRIKFIRKGYRLGPTAWVSPRSAGSRFFDLPDTFDVEQLPPPELRLAVELGVLTLDILTRDQRHRWEESLLSPVPKGSAASLLHKLATGSTETRD